MIIILQTSFIVEWHKSSVHWKKGVNSTLEYLINISCKIFWSATLWRMTPKNYELGGVYIIQIVYSAIFSSQKEKWHTNKRIVKWMTNQNAKVLLPLFYTQFWFLNLYVEVIKNSMFSYHTCFPSSAPGRIWNWRSIINEWAEKEHIWNAK